MKRCWRIAGLTVGFTSADGAALPRPYGDFEIPLQPCALELEHAAALPSLPAEAQPCFDSEGVWRAFEDGDGFRYALASPAFEPPDYAQARVDRQLTRGQVALSSAAQQKGLHALSAPLEQLLVSHRLSLDGAVQLHGVGLKWRGRAVVLVGHSGAGKSTSSRLWCEAHPDAVVLSDDRVVLRLEGDRLFAHGTPWHGEAAQATPAALEVGALVLLEHGARDALTPVRPARVLGELYARTFPPVFHREAVEATLRTLEAAATRAPCLRFAFRPQASAIAALKSGLAALW